LVLVGREVAAYYDDHAGEPASPVDLLAVPLDREDAGMVDVRATLQEALTELNRIGGNALCVTRASRPKSGDEPIGVVGVLTRQDIEQQAWW